MTRYTIALAMLATVGCGGTTPTTPSPIAATPATPITPPPVAPTCAAITGVRIEGQTVTVSLNQPASVTIDRKQGGRLERDAESNGPFQGRLAWDNDYIATATCANKATDTRDFHIGKEPSCGGCDAPIAATPVPPPVEPPITPPPPPPARMACTASVTWLDPDIAAHADRQTATLSRPCTGLYYVAFGLMANGARYRPDPVGFDAGGVRLFGQWPELYPRYMVELRDFDGVVLSTVEGVTR